MKCTVSRATTLRPLVLSNVMHKIARDIRQDVRRDVQLGTWMFAIIFVSGNRSSHRMSRCVQIAHYISQSALDRAHSKQQVSNDRQGGNQQSQASSAAQINEIGRKTVDSSGAGQNPERSSQGSPTHWVSSTRSTLVNRLYDDRVCIMSGFTCICSPIARAFVCRQNTSASHGFGYLEARVLCWARKCFDYFCRAN